MRRLIRKTISTQTDEILQKTKSAQTPKDIRIDKTAQTLPVEEKETDKDFEVYSCFHCGGKIDSSQSMMEHMKDVVDVQ